MKLNVMSRPVSRDKRRYVRKLQKTCKFWPPWFDKCLKFRAKILTFSFRAITYRRCLVTKQGQGIRRLCGRLILTSFKQYCAHINKMNDQVRDALKRLADLLSTSLPEMHEYLNLLKDLVEDEKVK